MAQVYPDRAVEFARQFPLQAVEIAMVLSEDRITDFIALADIASSEGTLQIVSKHPEIVEEVAVNNPDLVLQIVSQFAEKERREKVIQIADKIIGRLTPKDSDQKLITALWQLMENYPQQARHIMTAIRKIGGDLAKEFELPTASA